MESVRVKGFFEFKNCSLIETCLSGSKANVTFNAECTEHLCSSLTTSFEQLIFRTWLQEVPHRFQGDYACHLLVEHHGGQVQVPDSAVFSSGPGS